MKATVFSKAVVMMAVVMASVMNFSASATTPADYVKNEEMTGELMTAKTIFRNEAVSYTHLDVYKRQWYTRAVQDDVMSAWWVMPFERNCTITLTNYGEPVSYTHLIRMTTQHGGVVRIMLNDVPEGKYKLLINYFEKPNGADFQVWQRQKQLSGWISGTQSSSISGVAPRNSATGRMNTTPVTESSTPSSAVKRIMNM